MAALGSGYVVKGTKQMQPRIHTYLPREPEAAGSKRHYVVSRRPSVYRLKLLSYIYIYIYVLINICICIYICMYTRDSTGFTSQNTPKPHVGLTR